MAEKRQISYLDTTMAFSHGGGLLRWENNLNRYPGLVSESVVETCRVRLQLNATGGQGLMIHRFARSRGRDGIGIVVDSKIVPSNLVLSGPTVQ